MTSKVDYQKIEKKAKIRDHSLMADLIEQRQITPAEAKVHPNRSLITRALGNDPKMFADKYEIDVDAGDRILLCSDGLSGMLSDDSIENLLTKIHDPQECADKLVEQANYYGGQDNITVIVIDIQNSVAKHKKTKRKSLRNALLIAFLALVLFGGAIGAAYAIINNSAYLCEEEGYVSIYKGLPGSIGSFSFSHKEYGSDVWVKDLRQSTQDHFKDGVIRVASLDEAWHVLDNYKQEAQELKEKQGKQNQNNNNQDNKDNNKDNTKNNYVQKLWIDKVHFFRTMG